MPLPTREALDALRRAGDDDADRFVEALRAQPGGLARLADLLNLAVRWYDLRGAPPAGLPAEVVEFIRTPAPPPPDWLPAGAVERAQALFRDCRYAALVVLACASLPACYAQPHIADVLSASGRLVNGVRRRLQETVFFTSTVMTPGALEPGGVGHAWIRKVRLIHAMMRPLALADPGDYQQRTGDELADLLLRMRWRDPSLVPVNQTELGFVLLTFSWLTLRGWGRLRVDLSDAERNDFVLAWAWIGQLLGIRDELLPYVEDPARAAQGAEALYERIRAAYELGTEGGRLLAATLGVVFVEQQSAALRDAILPSLPQWLGDLLAAMLKAFPAAADAAAIAMSRSLVRQLAGRATADQLRVGRAPFLIWLPSWLLNQLVHFRKLERQPRVYAALGSYLEEFIDVRRDALRY